MSNVNLDTKALEDLISSIISTSNVHTDEELLNLRNYTIDLISACFSKHLAPTKKDSNSIDYISSDEVTIEVKDIKTNKIFRRTLELSYMENSNGLKLSGENLKGQPSEIVFLSNTAVDKIKDVTGQGLNHSRCHD